MTHRWSSYATAGGRIVECVNAQGWRWLSYLGAATAGQTHYLMPGRLVEYDEADAQQVGTRVIGEMIQQTDALSGKIAAIDRLELSNFVFHERFVAARSYLIAPVTACADTGAAGVWEFAKAALTELQESLELTIVSQIDYDQKQLHPVLGGILESVDFVVRHDPSAVATVVAYQRIIEDAGINMRSARFTVDGIGDLGYRIVKLLSEAGAERVFVCDKNECRLELAQTFPRVEPYERANLAELDCHAHIMSNNRTFDDAMAAIWAAQPSVRAVGGPEAGIDRFHDARQLLHRAGKQFVPSVLCGSLGLICNLEESLGRIPDLDAMTVRYDELIQRLVARMRERDVPFAEVCQDFLKGGRSVRAYASSR
jgi:hypothetical protein